MPHRQAGQDRRPLGTVPPAAKLPRACYRIISFADVSIPFLKIDPTLDFVGQTTEAHMKVRIGISDGADFAGPRIQADPTRAEAALARWHD
jgi:hypothetical protein